MPNKVIAKSPDLRFGKQLRVEMQHWLQEYRPGGVGWIDYGQKDTAEEAHARLKELSTDKPKRTFRQVVRCIEDVAVVVGKRRRAGLTGHRIGR